MQAIERIRAALNKHAAAKTLAEAWMLTDEIEDALSIESLNEVLAHIDALTAENERLRMQVVACGVVAMADTPASSVEARNMHPDYKSASCDDVARRVDECITLRAEVERLKGDYHHACKLVADMHAAAVGEVTGPKAGVVEDVAAVRAELERLRKDAERYRWLRKQHWSDSDIAVVVNPKKHTRLGAVLPSLELLDETIDHMRKGTP